MDLFISPWSPQVSVFALTIIPTINNIHQRQFHHHQYHHQSHQEYYGEISSRQALYQAVHVWSESIPTTSLCVGVFILMLQCRRLSLKEAKATHLRVPRWKGARQMDPMLRLWITMGHYRSAQSPQETDSETMFKGHCILEGILGINAGWKVGKEAGVSRK